MITLFNVKAAQYMERSIGNVLKSNGMKSKLYCSSVLPQSLGNTLRTIC